MRRISNVQIRYEKNYNIIRLIIISQIVVELIVTKLANEQS